MFLATMAAAVYMLCISLLVIIVEQITGMWGFMERAVDDYTDMLTSSAVPVPIYEWASSYPLEGPSSLSFATWLFLLLVPGPLTLGLSTIWLRVIRGQQVFADMVFSGFNNFMRALLLHFVRGLLMFIWAIFLIIPGVIAYYRYSLAFFLLVDNPEMSPFVAINMSKYYMIGNKGNRFFLDLSFIGWFVLAMIVFVFLSNVVVAGIASPTLFSNMLVMGILGSIILAPLCAYRGVAAAEYYHRVICKNPDSFKDPLMLPGV